MRNQKGITLIALVITIIVLLILAGVSIAMLTGQNGILTQANNAQTSTIEAEIKEEINLAVSTINADLYDDISENKYEALNYDTIVEAINADHGANTASTTSGTATTGGTITYNYTATKSYTVDFDIENGGIKDNTITITPNN